MRNKSLIFGIVGVVLGALFTTTVIGVAGSLNPVGGPTDPASQMYTLEQLFERLESGETGSMMTSFTEPSAGPNTSTMHTLNEIMDLAPEVDDSSGATTAEVMSGKTFWGLDSGEWGLQTGAAPAGSDVYGGEGERIFNIPVGFYTGAQTCNASDSDLIASNIKSGTDIFGVIGNYLCQDGLENCSGTCRNLDTDPNNCGYCGHACDPGEVCDGGGGCVLSCQYGLTNCAGKCVDLMSDAANCGSCYNACSSGYRCSSGTCTLACQQGLTSCGGVCRDLATDRNNCGMCGLLCGAGKVCDNSTCSLSCQFGLVNCNGVCTNWYTDRSNCGQCGLGCSAGYVCDVGSCSLSCQTGLTSCSDVCTHLDTDNNNCGQCGRMCEAGTGCQNGTCTSSINQP